MIRVTTVLKNTVAILEAGLSDYLEGARTNEGVLLWDILKVGIEKQNMDDERETGEDGSPDTRDIVGVNLFIPSETVSSQSQLKFQMPPTILTMRVVVWVMIKNNSRLTEIQNTIFSLVEDILIRNQELRHPETEVEAAVKVGYVDFEQLIDASPGTLVHRLAGVQTWTIAPKANTEISITPKL